MNRIEFESLYYYTDQRIAYIVLNRPKFGNAISLSMPKDIKDAVDLANRDNNIHCIVLKGCKESKGFCGGYDLTQFAEKDNTKPRNNNNNNSTKMVWDSMSDYYLMKSNTEDFMSLQKSLKPTICSIHGFGAIAGGSDIALCCDIVIMEKNSRIGYPPSVLWGVPTTFHWQSRIGAEKAKYMLFTGDTISGETAKQWGLIFHATTNEKDLETYTHNLATRISRVPLNQLAMNKLVINQSLDLQGRREAQSLATVFDGVARNSNEGKWFEEQSQKHGFKAAVKMRDGGEIIAENRSLPFYKFEDLNKMKKKSKL